MLFLSFIWSSVVCDCHGKGIGILSLISYIERKKYALRVYTV